MTNPSNTTGEEKCKTCGKNVKGTGEFCYCPLGHFPSKAEETIDESFNRIFDNPRRLREMPEETLAKVKLLIQLHEIGVCKEDEDFITMCKLVVQQQKRIEELEEDAQVMFEALEIMVKEVEGEGGYAEEALSSVSNYSQSK